MAILACNGAPMRVSHAVRPRSHATTPQLPTSCVPPLRHRLHHRLSAAAADAAATQPSDGNGSTSISTTPAADTVPAAAAASAPAELPPAPQAPAAPAAAPVAPPAGQPAAPSGENFTGDMLKPSIVNTPAVRAASVLAAVAAVAGSTVLLPNTVGAFLHVTSYAVLLGTQLWNTFFVGLTMFKNLPRQTFGKVQAKLFPQYFALTTGANLLALVTLALAGASGSPAGVRALVALGLSLGGLLVNWLAIEPVCTRLMFERYDIENLPDKTEADKDRIATLYKQFGKWHGISSLINLVSFCVAVGHGWFLASLLIMAA
ncbi:hypothetical protein PLESTB_001268800 [Pleodorina starrii]|uniref:TMEM205-like domain-containing protein n=1 Tax=Pleodorina starrii TaxID=330485 RepID=A0A9W6BTQ5_9CHLO|nr:hypothetical protein PLESTM_000717800 [Pleodorina starrii]GLC57805.1 hypothetical protein PLESTB_001268800 [Pleodorina starrii]GLC75950.1 hypothetical protein PLESTF_001710500 [Pleodorina starrii]